MGWTTPLTKDKRRVKFVLEALVKRENWEDSPIIRQKDSEVITQWEENSLGVGRACISEVLRNQ